MPCTARTSVANALDLFACREVPATPYGTDPSPSVRRAPRPARAVSGRVAGLDVIPPAGRAPYSVERSLLQADRLALALRGALERLPVPLGRAAAGFVRDQAWTAFGFARLEDHARERFGRSGRWVRDAASLGSALASPPALGPALTGEDGGPPLGRVAAVLIGRVARPGSLAAWVTLARTVPVRGLRAAVAEARAADSSWPPGSEPAGLSPSAGIVDPSPGGDRQAPADDATSADNPVPRALVRVPVPSPILAAFDEAVDLYRAVEGAEMSVTSFIEALVAESLSGCALSHSADPAGAGRAPFETDADRPPSSADADRVSIRRGADVAVVEAALARSTRNWDRLPRSSSASWALHLAGASLARLEELCRIAGAGAPADLDAQIRALILLENDLETRLGHLLAEMAEGGAWARLWFAGVGHYAEERLGLSRTAAEDRLRAARALRRFPVLRSAHEQGRIGLEATLLVLRLLGPGPVERHTETAWTARAEEATVKRLRDEARALGRCLAGVARETGRASPLDGRSGAPDGTPGPTDGPTHPSSDPPRPLDDAEWHASLRRAPGTARERLLRFGALALVWTDRAGALPAPDVFLRLRLPDDLAGDFLTCIDAVRKRLSAEVARVPWDEPWPEADPRPSTLAARTFSTRSRRVPAWVGLLALLEDFVITWDGGASLRDSRPPRARSAPRHRGDSVYVRDGWRCSAPGCSSRRNLEDHHVVYRSRCGPDDLANRICLCRFHHQRGEHGDLASCRGTAPLAVVWRLGRTEIAAWYRNERRLHPGRSPSGPRPSEQLPVPCESGTRAS